MATVVEKRNDAATPCSAWVRISTVPFGAKRGSETEERKTGEPDV